MMTAANFSLPSEPGRVVVGFGSVGDPLPEASTHLRQVVTVRFTTLGRERMKQLRLRADEAVPNVEDCVSLSLEDGPGATQRCDVVVGHQKRCLDVLQFLDVDG